MYLLTKEKKLINSFSEDRVTKQHWIIGAIALFFILIVYGILDNQDKEITQKNRVTLSVRASAEALR